MCHLSSGCTYQVVKYIMNMPAALEKAACKVVGSQQTGKATEQRCESCPSIMARLKAVHLTLDSLVIWQFSGSAALMMRWTHAWGGSKSGNFCSRKDVGSSMGNQSAGS